MGGRKEKEGGKEEGGKEREGGREDGGMGVREVGGRRGWEGRWRNGREKGGGRRERVGRREGVGWREEREGGGEKWEIRKKRKTNNDVLVHT